MSLYTPANVNSYPLGMVFLQAASAGLVADCVRVSSLGNNSDIDTGTAPEDIWSGSDLGILNGIDHKQLQIPNGPVSLEVVSSSANDTAAGTGLRTAILTYLDSTFVSKTITVTLNGTTPVALPEPVVAINVFVRSTSGTFRGNNIGGISIRVVGGLGATYSYMRPGDGLAKSSLFTVPAGYTLLTQSLLLTISTDVGTTRFGDFSLYLMNATGVPLRGFTCTISSSTPYRHEADGMIVVSSPEKSYIWLTCETVSGSNATTTGGLTGVLIKNTRMVVS